MYKRLFGQFVTPFIFTLAFLFGGVSFVSAAAWSGFTDVKETDDHYEGIKALTEQEIITGYEDGTFKQWDDISRQHIAVLLYRAKNLEAPEDLAATLELYDDVDVNSEYAKEIAAVTEAGIFTGSNGKFHEKKPITREQMASVLVRAMGLEKHNRDENVTINITNVDASHKKAVQILANLALTDQLTDFRPSESISRGAAVSLVHRAGQVGFQLSLMHMNDTHARVDLMPKMVTAINEVRETKPSALLLHAGDVFSGTLYFNEFEGQADLALLHLMGFDAMVFGNHEFDLGSREEGHQALAEFIEGANFPFVAANIDFSADEQLNPFVSEQSFAENPDDGKIYKQIVKEVDGERVGIFGLTTEDTVNIASPGAVVFSDFLAEAEQAVASFEAAGIDKIIALTHIGYDSNPIVGNDLLLAEVDGIDIIVGGHSHTKLEAPVVVDKNANGEAKDPTVIVQADQYVSHLGTLDVEFNDDGVIVGYAGELISVGEKEEDAEAASILVEYAEAIEELTVTESGAIALKELTNPRFSDGGGESVRANETALGNLVTDGMLAKAREYNPDTVIAMQNGGGIRTSIDEGPITLGEIIEVLPFGNTLAIVELSGAEIKAVLEHSVSNAPGESGGFLHVAGMKYTFDSSREVGDRVVSMQVQDGEDFVDIVATENYIVTTNAFTAKGGDGFDMLKEAYDNGRVHDLGLSDWENLRDHMVELGTVNPKVEGRIIDLAASES